MPKLPYDHQATLAVCLTLVALAAGTAGFAYVVAHEHSKCLSRHSDRPAAELRQLCGRPL